MRTHSILRNLRSELYRLSPRLLTILLIAVALLRPCHNRPGRGTVIRAVLFFSPTCSHCHYVMEEVLPHVVEKYPEQLDIVGIDVSQQLGRRCTSPTWPITMCRRIVWVSHDDHRRGDPGRLQRNRSQSAADYRLGLVQGGVDWPGLPGLQQVLNAQPKTASGQPARRNRPPTCRYSSNASCRIRWPTRLPWSSW